MVESGQLPRGNPHQATAGGSGQLLPVKILGHFGLEYNPAFAVGAWPHLGGRAFMLRAEQSVHGRPERLCGPLFSVGYQESLAHLDTLTTDIHPLGAVRPTYDECLYLMLGLAAKRTSGDFISRVGLVEHGSSMPSWRGSFESAAIATNGSTLWLSSLKFPNSRLL